MCALIVTLLLPNVSALTLHPSLFAPPIFTVSANRYLPNKQILKLEQDERGFIWVGTRGGVYRFDGYTYEKLMPSNASVDLSNVYVRALAAYGNYLWIGSMSSGAYRVDLRTLHTTHFIHDPQNPLSLGGNQVNGIERSSNGAIWLAHSFGLDRFDDASNHFNHFFSQDAPKDRYYNYLLDLEFDSNGKLWLSTAKGMARFQSELDSFSLFNQKNNSSLKSSELDGVVARRLFLASDGRLWLATQKQGSYIIEPDQLQVKKLDGTKDRDDVVNTAIAETINGSNNRREIWISGMTGIEIRDADSGELLKVLRGNAINKFGLHGDTVYPIMRSSSGLIWLGVNDEGLQFFNPDTSNFLYMDRYSTKLQPLFSAFINKVIPVNEKEVLVLTEKNAYRLNLLNGAVTLFLTGSQKLPEKLAGGLIDDSGVYWFGGGNGDLYQVSIDLDKVTPYVLPLTKNEGVFVRNIIEGQQNELWIGTDRGLVKLNRKTMTFHQLKNEDGSPFISYVRNLFVDSKNRLWIGTTSGLGVVHSGDDRVRFYSVEQRTDRTLSHNTIYQVIENQQGKILVYTRSGIDRLVSDVSEKILFEPFARQATEHLNTEDRLVQMNDGHYWLGMQFILGKDGQIISRFSEPDGALESGRGNDSFLFNAQYLMRVTPGWIMLMEQKGYKVPEYQSQSLVTEVMIGSQKQRFDFSNPGIHLVASDDQFSVRFASRDFSAPELNQYRYKLVGYDKEWVSTPADIRQAKYTALPPGRYELLLQSSNRNGVWQSTPLAIKVTVEPKYYQTLWFQGLIVLTLLLLSFLTFRWRLAIAQKKQQEIFEKKEAIQRAEMVTELMEQKNRMLAEVTHDLRTPLATIKVQLEAMQDGVLQANEKSYESLQNRLSSLNHLVGDLYQLSLIETNALTLNRQSICINDLLFDTVKAFEPMLNQKNLTLEYTDHSSGRLRIQADKDRLVQVFSNLLKNSCRYTDSGGKVCVSIRQVDDSVIIIFEDTAPSISRDECQKIFERLYRAKSTEQSGVSGSGLGLWICQSIIQAHGGDISAEISTLGGLSITMHFELLK